MNVKISLFIICVEVIIYLLLYNLHDCTFKSHSKFSFENKDFCEIAMSSEKDNILKFNQYMKLDKMQNIIYADIESLI